ncbi:MAG: hypothetical protein LBL36_01840, partial [Clostridiales Family XIII bacterium]|nr:hypothetical protein [Clostridiales Family XIII bacterium]
PPKNGDQEGAETLPPESGDQPIAPVTSETGEKGKRLTAQQDAGGVIFSVSTKLENNQSFQVFLPVFCYRPQGEQSWTTVTTNTDTSGYYRFYIDKQEIKDDTAYQYVLTYRVSNSPSNFSFQVCKLIGSFQRDSSGQWTHTNDNREPVTTQREVSDEAGYSFMVEHSRRISTLVYNGFTYQFFPSAERTSSYFRMTDPLDGTPAPVYATGTNATLYAIVKGGPSQPIGVYKRITTDATPTGSTSISYRDVAYPYSINVPDYFDASGTFYPIMASDGSYDSGNIGSAAINGNSHTMTFTPSGFTGRWNVGLKYAVPSITVNNILENTTITLTQGDQSSFEQRPSQDGALLRFTNLPSGENKLVVELAADGLFTIPLRITVVPETATVTLTNLDEILTLTETADYDAVNGVLKLTQLLKMDMEHEGGAVIAKSPATFKHVSNNRLLPGVPLKKQFRVYNGSKTASYKVVGYDMSPDYTKLSTHSVIRALPDAGTAIYNYMQKYNPGELAKTQMRFAYDFEGVNGVSLYEGLLRYYRELPGNPYPNLTRLEDLPTSVISNEIFFGSHPYFSLAQVDTANEHVMKSSEDAYLIWEYDTRMIELANHLLYERALFISFDNSPGAYPWSSSNPAESYPAYRDKTPENKAMMDTILSGLPIIKPGGTVSFDNFAFGVSGALIHNPYLVSHYDFGFDFSLRLAVIGVEGIAFEDVNASGAYEPGADRLLPETKLRLFRDGEADFVAETTTDKQGRYEFADVPAGNKYYLSVETATGMELIQKGTGEAASHFDPDSKKTDTFLVEKDEAYRYNAGFAAKQNRWTVTYHGNGATGAVTDDKSPYSGGVATILPHNYKQAGAAGTGFEWPGHRFTSWNTAPDGSGTKYLPGDKVTMDRDYVLYAQWETAIPEPFLPGNVDPPGGKARTDGSTPVTGDNGSPWLYILCGTAMASLIILLVRKRRRST